MKPVFVGGQFGDNGKMRKLGGNPPEVAVPARGPDRPPERPPAPAKGQPIICIGHSTGFGDGNDGRMHGVFIFPRMPVETVGH